MKLNCIIIEDEPNSQNLLKTFLTEHCDNVGILGISPSIKKGKKLIQKHDPDLIFLDIELQDGLGFELLEKFDSPRFATVFITGYEHFTYKAIKHSGIDYILKPYSIKELQNAVEKARKHVQAFRLLQELDDTKEELTVKEDDTILLKTKRGSRYENIDNILYITFDDPYSCLFLADGSNTFVQTTLKNIETIFPPNRLMRIHRKHLVNLNKVESWSKGKGGTVTLEDGTILEISYRAKTSFLQYIKDKTDQ